MLHHAVVYTTDSSGADDFVFSDLSKSELKKKLVVPYKKGRDIFHNGRLLKLSEIKRVKIVTTADTSEIERKRVQDSSYAEIQRMNQEPGGVILVSAGWGYEESDIAEIGTDVTSLFINAAPPSSSSGNLFSRVFNNTWVVRIGGGVATAALIWFFGFKDRPSPRNQEGEQG